MKTRICFHFIILNFQLNFGVFCSQYGKISGNSTIYHNIFISKILTQKTEFVSSYLYRVVGVSNHSYYSKIVDVGSSEWSILAAKCPVAKCHRTIITVINAYWLRVPPHLDRWNSILFQTFSRLKIRKFHTKFSYFYNKLPRLN